MPEMTFTVRWPDGRVEACSSPSLVMWDHLEVGADYTVGDFTRRATAALAEAGERVRARYGFVCTSALAQAEAIRARAAGHDAGAPVRVLAMAPPLPVRVSA
ncbi:MSMEG_0570 family nitrogen starvation response protein [uncultured Amnibacterium sp.]|uniref:MSMEG_0570 family nitrogen starvation response protein n=1 Tax=uncultured Amnibacterium sp. TaxID=1631851 RepID=UPI0035CC4010